ncbi:MAG TPA: hypothetical protein VN823_01590 [Stellaceae bacterium]|nr:hypothetical protein [Stellaceae bacterium]
MSESGPRHLMPRIYKIGMVGAGILFVLSIIVQSVEWDAARDRPDEMHTHREVRKGGRVSFLTEPQGTILDVLAYVSMASFAVLAILNGVASRIKEREKEEAVRRVLAEPMDFGTRD